jgi:hypothetical protein
MEFGSQPAGGGRALGDSGLGNQGPPARRRPAFTSPSLSKPNGGVESVVADSSVLARVDSFSGSRGEHGCCLKISVGGSRARCLGVGQGELHEPIFGHACRRQIVGFRDGHCDNYSNQCSPDQLCSRLAGQLGRNRKGIATPVLSGSDSVI